MGRLLVGAAIGVGEQRGIEKVRSLVEVGVDVVVIDTNLWTFTKCYRNSKKNKKYTAVTVIVGNIYTSDAALDLIRAGADSIKGKDESGSICTTRIIAGMGVPQLHAISETYKGAKKYNIPIISDGGIKFSGDVAKAIAFGADVVMIGSLFAGTDESLGEMFLSNGRTFKSYRGMGSLAAMGRGINDRYFQR